MLRDSQERGCYAFGKGDFMHFALIALLAIGQPAAEAKAGAAAETAEQTKEPRKICRRLEAETGSRLAGAKKVCRTAAEWQADGSRGGADLDKLEHSAK